MRILLLVSALLSTHLYAAPGMPKSMKYISSASTISEIQFDDLDFANLKCGEYGQKLGCVVFNQVFRIKVGDVYYIPCSHETSSGIKGDIISIRNTQPPPITQMSDIQSLTINLCDQVFHERTLSVIFELSRGIIKHQYVAEKKDRYSAFDLVVY